ncbi:MAG: GTPase HflX [Candidatus Margulisiibacteriota bacterium]
MSEKAILVGVKLNREDKQKYASSFEELKLLAQTAGVTVVETVMQNRENPDNKFFVGKGKVDEIREVIEQVKADMVIFNEDLTPSQQKNLEDLLQVQVIDRVGLILDIFAKRANTQEAQLQVELAQYQYILPRLTRMWLHLSRQAGFIGTKGPGETQLEVDRRRIGARIKMLKQKTSEVRKHHQLLRDGRKKRGAKMVALVGYTNAGKSTLLNSLTNGDVYVENKLFATLDPTVRQLYMPGVKNVVLSDTVGFIQRLPHQLVDAFKATLDEVVTADLLLHVVDSTADNIEQQIKAVFLVLEEIGAINKPMLMVFNKADKLNDEQKANIQNLAEQMDSSYTMISALRNEGTDVLLSTIEESLLKQ